MNGEITRDELSTRLDNELLYNTDTVDRAIADIEIKGRTLVNLLGRTGNAIYQQAVPIELLVSYSGDEFVLTSKQDSLSFGTVNFGGDNLKSETYYLFMCEAKSDDNQTEVGLTFSVSNNWAGKMSHTKTFSDKYSTIYSCAKYPSGGSNPSARLYVKHESVGGKVGRFKNYRIYEVSKEVYDLIDASPEYTGEKLAQKYPYVDDVKCVTNPYLESKENLLNDCNYMIGYYTTTDDLKYASNSSSKTVCILPVKLNGTYTLLMETQDASIRCRLHSYENSYQRIGEDLTSNNSSATFTLNGKFAIGVYKVNSSEEAIDASDIPNLISKGDIKFSLVKGSVPKKYEDCNNSRIVFNTKLYEGEVITKCNDGTYIKNSEWEETTILDINQPITYNYKTSGYKRVKIANTGINVLKGDAENSRWGSNAYVIDYAGKKLPLVQAIETPSDGYNFEGTDSLFIQVPNTLTGWGDSYTPTQEEIKAFFLGYRMFVSDTSGTMYNGSGTKAWAKLWSGTGTYATSWTDCKVVSGSGSNVLPTTINDYGYTPYKLIYKRTAPTKEEVKTYGGLVVKEGVDVAVSSGYIIQDIRLSNIVNSANKDYCHLFDSSNSLNRGGGIISVRKNNRMAKFECIERDYPRAIEGSHYGKVYVDDCIKPLDIVSVEYIIFKFDTVTSYDYAIKTNNNVLAAINKAGDELSATKEELANTKRELEKARWEISQIGKPNLLINGDFKVNQRGSSEYNVTSSAVSGEYTFDRWVAQVNKAASTQFKVSPAQVGININYSVLATGASMCRLGQFVEITPDMLGKTFTLSAKISNFKVSSGTYSIADILPTRLVVRAHSSDFSVGSGSIPSLSEITIRNGILHSKFTIPEDTKRLFVFFHAQFDQLTSNYQGDSISFNVDWIKLELGEYATPFVPRSYGEELALCQRYYYEFSSDRYSHVAFMKFVRSYGWGFIPLPTNMRTYPTPIIEDDSTLYLDINNVTAYIAKSNFSILQYGNCNGLSYRVSGVSANIDFPGMLVKVTGKKFALDAEIY